jgi:hypothetical protein
MSITRRDLAGLTVVGIAAASAVEAQAQVTGRRAEVAALRLRAETLHPRGRDAAANVEWRARWDGLAADADQVGDGAYFIRTREALGWFKDGHTTILPFEFTGGVPAPMAHGPFALSLPVGVRVFHDGAYVTSAKNEGAPLLGARLTRIGSMDVVALMRAWATNWPGNNAWAHRWAGTMFSPAFLEAFGAVRDAGAPIRVEGMLGHRRVHATLRPRPDGSANLQPLQRTKAQVELWSDAAGQAASGNFVERVGEAIYVSCDDLGVGIQPFGVFTNSCFEAMEDASARRLIIDLRRNGGGNNFLFEALRKRVERSRFNYPGALYVMISPLTFSAAQNAANRLERETFALFVGEPSGGAPNHYGDGQVSVGASTGLTSLVSTLPWFDSYPQDERVWIMTDLPSPHLFADWRDGRDPALQIGLTHTSDAPANEWDEANTFYFRRPSQAAEWRPFWRQP